MIRPPAKTLRLTHADLNPRDGVIRSLPASCRLHGTEYRRHGWPCAGAATGKIIYRRFACRIRARPRGEEAADTQSA